jgi:GTPase Era involved in 16S rRNA processing
MTTEAPYVPPQVALYDTPGVTSAVRNREHGARVQGAWQVAQHCGVVLFLVDAARQVTNTQVPARWGLPAQGPLLLECCDQE